MAKLIFLKGLSEKLFVQAGFRKDFNSDLNIGEGIVTLKITGRTYFRVFLNGEFLSYGPARSAHQHARMDQIDISSLINRNGINSLAIEVAGHNLGGQDSTGESSFLYASIEVDGKEIIGTDSSWKGLAFNQRRNNVEMYSHARAFNELYDLDEVYNSWTTASLDALSLHPVEEVSPDLVFIPRGVRMSSLLVHNQYSFMGVFNVRKDNTIQTPLFFYETSDGFGIVPEHPAYESMTDAMEPFTGNIEIDEKNGLFLSCDSPAAVETDFKKPVSGFAGCHFTVDQDSIVEILHSDRLHNGKLEGRRKDGCNDVIRLYCKAGNYRFESFNPYLIRYLRITLRSGHSINISKLYIREYQYMDSGKGSFICSDESLNRIYEAACLTFKANALDVFMDCPDRERAGWLCDSFWTSRAEKLLFGDTAINHAMIQNYIDLWHVDKAESGFKCCYPSNIEAKMPTWSMFFVMQLEEYWHFSNDRPMVDAFKLRIIEFIDGLEKYENKEGLLENLPGWIFVDWSCANDDEHINPVSVAVNALYSACLSTTARLFGKTDYEEKAKNIRETLRKFTDLKDIQPMGGFFPDALQRNEKGELVPKKKYSTACQYYCFWLGVSDSKTKQETFDNLVEEYGCSPNRLPKNLYLTPSDVFIALFIRMDMLSKFRKHKKLLEDMKYLFGYMLDNGPGTFWEGLSGESSLCHGFTSHAGVWLVQDFLGLGIPDEVTKEIIISPHPCSLSWARGVIETNNGIATLNWRIENEKFHLDAYVPHEYKIKFKFPRELLTLDEWIINGKSVPANKMLVYIK